MNVLAVDTALGACSVAVLKGGEIAGHRWVAMLRGHAEALAPMVAETMRDAGLAYAALDRLGVTTGPGTFTGQRVGLAFMRGLRLALARPLVGVTTLEAMAAAAGVESESENVAVLHEARRDEVYVALYRAGSALIPVKLAKPAEAVDNVLQAVAAHGITNLVLAGTAAEAARIRLAEKGEASRVSSVRQPDALHVARLAAVNSLSGLSAKPFYLRPPDAKIPSGAIRLRIAEAGDAEVLAMLNQASLADAWSPDFFASILSAPGSVGVIAEARTTALGFVLVRTAGDEAEILALAVSEAYRRNGIGRRLLREGATRAAKLGATSLFLEVAAANKTARSLYEALGFHQAGWRKGYYANGEDALVLRALLPLEPVGNRPELD